MGKTKIEIIDPYKTNLTGKEGRKPNRSYLWFMAKVLEEIPKDHQWYSVSKMAEKTGLPYFTTKRFVELLELILNEGKDIRIMRRGKNIYIRSMSGKKSSDKLLKILMVPHTS